jgi:UDP-3-O-[3-hydroxymyristoyl] glucosamine N-acyltransferase
MKIYDLVSHDFIVKDNCEITKLSPIEDLDDNCVSFIDSTKNIDSYKHIISNRNLVIVDRSLVEKLKHYELGNFIFSDNPKLTFIRIANLFLEKNKKIEDVVTGDNFKHGENCVIKNCEIGNNVTIHSGTVIGEDGFGYIRDGDKYVNFPHIGKVIIEDDVSIYSMVVIDRGSLSNTVIRRGVKIDNYVHIGHNSEIGENTIITSKTLVAGSSKIGSNCFIGAGSLIIDKISIANNTFLGIGTVVLKSILNEGETWVGNPARKIR